MTALSKSMNSSWPGVRVWLALALGFFVFLYLIKSILLPFVVGMLTAYFLDPAADWLERRGFSRTAATLTITALFFTLMMTGLILLVPVLFSQLSGLIQALPDVARSFEAFLVPRLQEYAPLLGTEPVEAFRSTLQNLSGTAMQHIGEFAANLLQSGLALLNLLSLIFITPVVSFYLLRDWDELVKRLHRLLPRAYAGTIIDLLREVDHTLAGFLRGQINVCLLLGVFYATGLSLTGLNFGIAIGLMTGLLAIIPFAGIIFGVTLALAVAFFQFDHMGYVIAVAAVFAIGQFLEGNFITPKLVGERVGLHPLWIIFGMLAGAALFGFVGILIAVPVTAVLGVLARFAVARYLESTLYDTVKPQPKTVPPSQ